GSMQWKCSRGHREWYGTKYKPQGGTGYTDEGIHDEIPNIPTVQEVGVLMRHQVILVKHENHDSANSLGDEHDSQATEHQEIQ
ncbi:hypothetical protein HAX54_012851, partial [Datura stramonium]|nr:hypothetical protein [Datura stramonium]